MSTNKQSLNWFAVRVKSNRERITHASLEGRGYEVFLPEYNRSRNSSKRVEVPLFPGYLFCRFEVASRLPILILPGVLHIVCIGRIPAPVDPLEIESLKLVLKTGLPIHRDEVYTVGETVRIQEGPLSGALGVVAGEKNQRLMVSITLLQRTVSVALEKEWVAKLAPAHPRSVVTGMELSGGPVFACGY